MPDYKQMYLTLFSAICEAIESIGEANYGEAKQILIQSQQKTEEMYINAPEST